MYEAKRLVFVRNRAGVAVIRFTFKKNYLFLSIFRFVFVLEEEGVPICSLLLRM